MKFTKLLATMVIGFSVWFLSAASARADSVIYDGVGFLVGSESFKDSFRVDTAGTVTITLSNIAWPEELANLSLVLSSANGALGPVMQPGTESFKVQAGDVFAQWFGTAQGPMNAGVYGLTVSFEPSSSPVPLPTSVALLLSGLALLVWYRRTDGSARALPRAQPLNS
jgi:hypothetical protein